MKSVLVALFIITVLGQNQILNEMDSNPISTIVYTNEQNNDSKSQEQIVPQQQLQGYIDIDGKFVQSQAKDEIMPTVQADVAVNDPNDVFATNKQAVDLQASSAEGMQELVSADAELDPMIDMENSLPYEFPEDETNVEYENEDGDNHYYSASLELPIQNENAVYDSLGNQLDSLDGMKTYLALDSAEIDSTQASISVDEKAQDCIVIYSQCDFQGESLPICESLKEVEDFQAEIKSIYLPEGFQITIYSEENFEGQNIAYTESQKCLAKAITLAQLRGKQTQEQVNQANVLTANLRRGP